MGHTTLLTHYCVLQGGEGSKKRINLSLHVGRMNAGLSAASVVPGTALPAAVKGVEDHGYTLSFGIKVLLRHFRQSHAAHLLRVSVYVMRVHANTI